jgi:acetyl-CoA carboxylase biotin carboxyl carrier protein
MDLNQLKAILDLVREHELAEFEMEQEGVRLKIRKDGKGGALVTLPAGSALSSAMVHDGTAVGASAAPAGASAVPGASGAGPAGSAGASAASAIVAAGGTSGSTTEGVETEIELAVVKSPIVGTFYRSPEPGAAAFVDVGSSVKKGQVLCIIEAMKLMNEIDSEYDGEVVNVYVESGQAVQYGERLFAIRIR